MANSIVRFAAMYGPIVGVGVVCGGYFWDCLQEVFSPSTGFKIDYQTEAGLVNLQCQKYSFDPLSGTLSAQSFEVRHPNGKLIARLPRLLVTGLRIDQRFAPNVLLQDAQVWVRREKDGKLDLARYMPKSSEEPSNVAFTAELNRCRINVLDEAATGVPSNQIYIPFGKVSGQGENLFASLSLNIVGLASTNLVVTKTIRGIGIEGSNLQANPGRLRNRLLLGPEKKQWFDLDLLKVGEGRVTGEFHAMVPPKSGPVFAANLSGELANVGWDHYTAAKADLRASLTEKDVRFTADLSDSNAGAKVRGVADWSKGIRLDANTEVQRVTPQLLAKLGMTIPSWLKVADAEAKGKLGFHKGIVTFRGGVRAQNVSAFGLKTPTVAADLEVTQDGIKAIWSDLAIGKTKTDGIVSYQFKPQKWQIAAKSDRAYAYDFGVYAPSQLKDTFGTLSVIGGGTGVSYELLLASKLDAKIALGDRKLSLANTEILGRFDGKRFLIERATSEGPNGNLIASGTIDLKKGLAVNLEGSGLVLSQFLPELTGEADVKGRLVGSFAKPRFDGLVQAIGLGYGQFGDTLTAVTAEALVDDEGVSLTHVLGVKGAGQVSGDLGLRFKSQNLSGMLSAAGINISDFYEGPVAGVVDLKDVVLGGTLSVPKLSGKAEAPTLIAAATKLTSVSGGVSLEGSKFKLEGLVAKVADGSISSGGIEFDLKTKAGAFTGKADKLSFAELRQIVNRQIGDGKSDFLGEDLEVKGVTGAEFSVAIRNSKIESIKASGNVDSVKLNQAQVGAGDWKFGYDGQSYQVDAMLGSLDDYFQLNGANYNVSTKKLNGELIAYNVPIRELVLASESRLEKIPGAFERLSIVRGKMGLSALLGGTVDNPVVSLNEFEVSNLLLGAQNLGTLAMKGAYSADGWRISEGSIVGPKLTKLNLPFGTIKLSEKQGIPEGTARFSGGMSQGSVDAKLELVGFPLSKFAPLLTSQDGSKPLPAQEFLAKSAVRIDYADVKISGTREDPSLSADIESSLVSGEKTGPLSGERLRAKTKLSAVPRKGSDLVDLTQESTLSFKSLEALFKTTLPIALGDSEQQSQPLTGEFSVVGERSLADFLASTKDLKLGEKGARISGGYKLGGTLAKPEASGAIRLAVDQVLSTAVNPMIGAPVQIGLKNTSVELGFERDSRGLLGRLKGSTGVTTSDEGTISFGASVSLADLSRSVMDQIIEGGFVNVDRLRLAQIFPDASYANATITTPKPITITGNLGAPRIAGEIVATQVSSIIPTLLPTSGGEERLSIDPSFDLSYRIADIASIKSSTADMKLSGSGTLKGRLSNLTAEAKLVVESGQLALPGARVKLLPDGTLDFSYRADRVDSKAKMIANLTGETSLTVLKNAVTPERYDLTIKVDGDMLGKGGGDNSGIVRPGEQNQGKLTYTFPNRPADLSDIQIMGMLGRLDLINSVTQPGSNSQIEEDLRNAITSYALPNFLGGFTNRLAQNFGFEYVNVDYNAFEQTSISAAKSLGSGFFLQGRRQLATPLPGQVVAYDFRLAYRPRSGPQSIRNLSFSLGTDQIRPYKLSADFSQRVRTSKPPYRSLVWSVTPK
ncbi:MAG: hypothetical protein WCK51_03880 [Armatimonadota bacterium]